jgi:hypothetical protein
LLKSQLSLLGLCSLAEEEEMLTMLPLEELEIICASSLEDEDGSELFMLELLFVGW